MKAYAGKKVLVTGHTGFKGAWLSEWLLSMGADVAGFSIGPVSTPSLFELTQLSSRIRHYEGDIRDLGALETVFKEFRPEIVFHLAAQSLVRTSYDEPKETFDTNVGGTVNCLEAIRRSTSVKAAVIITTDKCYENVGWEYGYREVDRLGGKDPYSASKAAAELVSNAYIQSFFSNRVPIATVRAGNVIGGGDWAVDRVIPDCVRAWQKGEAVLVRNPQYVRPWQHVLEPLSGYLVVGERLLQRDPGVIGEAFNFGPQIGDCHSVDMLVRSFANAWKKPVDFRTENQTTTKKEAPLLRLNCEKAFSRLQWKPVLNFLETIEMTADWYTSYLSKTESPLVITQRQIAQFEK